MRPKYNLLNVAQCSVRDGKLQAALDSLRHRIPVHIIGAGPSALSFVPDDWPDPKFVIVLNKAVEPFKEVADMHVMIEENVWEYDWAVQDPPFNGYTVLAEGCAERADVKSYSEGFWNRALWCRRTQYKGQSLHEVGQGLILYHCYGSVALQAIHIARILEASEYHVWGVELWFPHGQQHFDGANPYKFTTDGLTKMVQFDIVNGEPVSGSGPFLSTGFYIMSSQAIRKVCAKAGIELIDHSKAGLLRPESLEEMR